MLQLLVHIVTTVCGAGIHLISDFFFKITPENTNSNILPPSPSAHESLRTEIPYYQYFELSSPRMHAYRHELR